MKKIKISNLQIGFYIFNGFLQSITSHVRSIILPVLIICTFSLLVPVEHCKAADIPVSGTISSDTAWTTGNTYILTGNITISAGFTLTVQNDVVVKFNAERAITVNGRLDTQGTSDNPVYFTDIRDDTVGGDSNGDGSATAPAASGWAGIDIRDGGSVNLVYTEMRYSGRLRFAYNSSYTYVSIRKTGNAGAITTDNFTLKDASNGIFIYDSSADHSFSDSNFDSIGNNGFFLENVSNISVQNSTIQNCTGNGIHLINSGGAINGNTFSNNMQSGLSVAGFSGSVTGNNFQNNSQYGFYNDGLTHPTFTGNTFSISILSPVGLNGDGAGMSVPASNTLDGPITITGGTTTDDVNWQSVITYRVNALTIGAGTTLTIRPPQIVKFPTGAVLVVYGTLDIQGTSENPIHFTDIRDDTVGGDSNADGNATSPAANGWGGILIYDGGSANLGYTEMRYSGKVRFAYNQQWTNTSILKKGNMGSITTNHLMLENAGNYGVFLWGTTAAHSFSNSTFDTIASKAFFLTGATDVTIQDSVVQNIVTEGIYMTDSSGIISGNTIRNNLNGIYMTGSSGIISGNTIRNNSRYGIYTSGALATPIIKNNIIKFNLTGVQIVGSANPVIGGSALNGNDIYGNTNYGVFNGDSGVTVNAEYNYWGDASGPYHAVTNPGAAGDQVSDYVSYGNFAVLPVNEIIPIINAKPASHDFGSIAVGLAASRTSTVRNNGNGILHVNSIALSGTDSGDFTVANDNCSGQDVAIAADCTFDLEFSPAGTGSKTAICAIDSNDPNSPDTVLSLSGSGSNPVLSVNLTGNGTGSVTSSPTGIDCGPDCSETYTIGSQVTLSAVPDSGSFFSGWSGGGCTGAGDCIVDMTRSLKVTAEFKLELIFMDGFEEPSGMPAESP